MIGLDSSFLIGLVIREHPAHACCWKLFEEQIRGRESSVGIAPQVLAEFAHVITDARRFERPLSMSEAVAIGEQWWHAGECRAVTPTPEAVSVFLSWMDRYHLGRKRLLDTLLAATYHSAGITRIATTNWRDFTIFDVFTVEALD